MIRALYTAPAIDPLRVPSRCYSQHCCYSCKSEVKQPTWQMPSPFPPNKLHQSTRILHTTVFLAAVQYACSTTMSGPSSKVALPSQLPHVYSRAAGNLESGGQKPAGRRQDRSCTHTHQPLQVLHKCADDICMLMHVDTNKSAADTHHQSLSFCQR